MRPIAEAIAGFDIEGWLSLHGEPKPSGFDNVSFNPCPICGSHRGKFYVNIGTDPDRRGAWNSHCCHDAGGLVRLVAAIEGIPEIEARALIRVESGEPIFQPPGTAPFEAERGRAVGLPEPLFPADPSFKIVHKRHMITLRERLIDEVAIDRYGLRLTGGQTFYAGKRRHDLDYRLVLPVVDADGRLLSWQARDLTGQSTKKYVFPAGASVTDTLFGYRRGVTGKSGFVIVVEGFFQKLGWDRLGGSFQIDVVASFGKKLTHQQVKLLLESPAKAVLLAWDLDAIPQMCQYATRLYGRRKVFFVPPLAPDANGPRDHDEVSSEQLIELLEARMEVTPAKIAELMTLVSLGHFGQKKRLA